VRVEKRRRNVPLFAASAAARNDDEVLDAAPAVASLPRAQRAAVVLRYMHDLAGIGGGSPHWMLRGSAKTHLSGRERPLAALLGEEED